MVECDLPKVDMWVRFPLPAPKFFVIIFLFFSLCVAPQVSAQEYSPPGIFHKIKSGQTLWGIARIYGVDILDLMKFNRLKGPSLIYAGRYLFIPGTKKSVESEGKQGYTSERYKSVKGSSFMWPVRGKVSSRMHGIEIACRKFSPVKAAEKGVIASAGIFRGYGNIVIIDHRNGYYTIYAHNERNISSRGEEIKKGQQIAIAGSTGRTEQPCVYFEIRKGAKALNPLAYLPR